MTGIEPCKARLVCKVKAIDPGESVFIDFSRCTNCQNCLPACTFGAIRTIHYQDLIKQ